MQLKIKSKKGLGMEFIITTSLVLISFFLIAGLFGKFTSRTSDLEAELLCQNSITQRARTALNVDWDVGGVSLFRSQVKSIPTICRTIDKKVSGAKEQILRQVADNMARCWWMFGEGRYEDILDSADASLFPEVFGLKEHFKVDNLKTAEMLMLSVNTSITGGMVRTIKKNEVEVDLKVPIVPFKNDNVGIARNINGHWRLIGYGEVL